ncbi:MAG: metal-dependent hydrolase [bacterium]
MPRAHASHRPARRARPADVEITVRKPSFDFSDVPAYWFGGSPWKTHFGTALMLVFPSGERFVVQGVRSFEPALADPALRQDVARFCAQEGFHSREHGKLNRFLFEQGFPGLRWFERLQSRTMKRMSRHLPKRFQLALAASIEHLTSSFGHQALATRDDLEPMHPVLRELLIWHAIEEMEHKSVAFDVHQATGGWHATRVAGLLLILPMLLAVTYAIFLYLLAADGRLLDGRMWKRELLDRLIADGKRVLAGARPRGLFGALPYDVIAFLRPSFHPWDVDDRALIANSKHYDPMAVLRAR